MDSKLDLILESGVVEVDNVIPLEDPVRPSSWSDLDQVIQYVRCFFSKGFVDLRYPDVIHSLNRKKTGARCYVQSRRGGLGEAIHEQYMYHRVCAGLSNFLRPMAFFVCDSGDSGDSSGDSKEKSYFVVFESVEGVPLERYLTSETARDVLLQLFGALDETNTERQRYAHGDLYKSVLVVKERVNRKYRRVMIDSPVRVVILTSPCSSLVVEEDGKRVSIEGRVKGLRPVVDVREVMSRVQEKTGMFEMELESKDIKYSTILKKLSVQ
jgi:hypothetical protein